jgi:hypothetical protein
MRQTPAATYRVVGVRFDGSRHVTHKGQTREKAEQERIMLIFTHSFPSAVVELEEPPAKPGEV